MIFENPFRFRRKGERRKRKTRLFIGVLLAIGVLFMVNIISKYLATPEPIGLDTLQGNTFHKGITPKIQKQAENIIIAHPILEKNPEQKIIDQRVQKLGKLSEFSHKPFLHTASIVQRDVQNLLDFDGHAVKLDMAFPDWLTLSETSCDVDENIDWNIFEILNRNKVIVYPRFSTKGNALSNVSFSNIIKNKVQSACLIDKLKQNIENRSAMGINIDIDEISLFDRDAYTNWLLSLTEVFHNNKLYVTVSVPMDNIAYDYGNIGLIADAVIIKAYNEHSVGGQPGPVAGIYWFENSLGTIMKKISPQKTIVEVGSHGYDWNITSGASPEKRSFTSTMHLAKSTQAEIKWDKTSWNSSFSYKANDGSEHEIWFLDGISAWNQHLAIKQKKFYGMSLSHIGNEDTSVWKFISSGSLDSFNPSTLAVFPSLEGMEIGGLGKFYKISTLKEEGMREISLSGKTIVGSKYTRLPENLTVSQFGDSKSKTIALTFYGGPDKDSDRILDLLKKYKIRATFFPSTAQMEKNPNVLKRAYSEGHILGNHVDWRGKTEDQSKNELIKAQGLIKSISGRQTLLTGAPLGMDSSVPPSTNEAKALYAMGSMGYVFMGSDINTLDLNKSSTDSIVKNIVSQLKNDSNIIALQDNLGNGEQILRTLEKLIPTLQAAGYQFNTANEILGVPRDALMPIIPIGERFVMFGSSVVSETKKGLWNFIVIMFIIATVVSLFRIIFLGVFVVRSYAPTKYFSRRFSRLPPVTILVPAYNEEKVIERTILGLLSSDYPDFEILVIDDGSKDKTAECVNKVIEKHPNVRLISKVNEGKSLALNVGFQEARYDYVITVDADTIVLSKTIYYLMEPFADNTVDAVCGNIGVGNVKNILTAFQEVEYVTGQGYDRRAFHTLNCISVVPGATGAWRKQKVIDIGGYSSDTLVEDADLTLTLLENGGRIVYAPLAKSVTEAPEMVGPLFKQRFRWCYGTFQCFWKHRQTFGKGTLGTIALPNMLFFQVVFPALSPIGDIVLLGAIFFGNLQPILLGYVIFFLMDAIVSGTAYALDKKSLSHIWVIFIQRFFYRQFMYFVTFKSIIAALRGSHHGWNKLERKGTVKVTETT